MAQQRKLGQILLDAGVVDEFQLRSALGEQQRWGGRLGITLIKLGFLEERDLVRALASQLGMPVVHLEGKRIEPDVLDLVPVQVAEDSMCLPLFVKEEAGTRTLFLGMEDPSDLQVLDELRFRTGMAVRPVLMGPSELCEGIDRFYHRRDPNSDTLELEAPVLPPSRDGEPPEAPAVPEPGAMLELDPDLGPDVAAAETAPAVPAVESAPVEPAAGEASTRTILRALIGLLEEKGAIQRDELTARVRALQARTHDD